MRSMICRLFLAASLTAAVIPAGQKSPAPPDPPSPPLPAAPVFAYSMHGGSFLGVGVAEVGQERARELGLKEPHGIEITSVDKDSPAAKAGIQKGDVVVDYNGTRVVGTEQFIRLVRETPVGREARLTVHRNGATQNLTATIGKREGVIKAGGVRIARNFELPEIWIPDIPRPVLSWRTPRLGIEAESVESQLAEFFGVKQGVLIRSVMKGSQAEKAGLKAGDVIVKVGETKVASPREISTALRGQPSKTTIELTLMREKKEMLVQVAVEEDRSERNSVPHRKVIFGGEQEL